MDFAMKDWIYSLNLNEQKEQIGDALEKYDLGLEELIDIKNKKEVEEMIDGISAKNVNIVWNGILLLKKSDKRKSDQSKSGKKIASNLRLSRRSNKITGIVPLISMGNTCFMNSAIQCLLQVPELTDYLVTHMKNKRDMDVMINVVEEKKAWISNLKIGDICDVKSTHAGDIASMHPWCAAKVIGVIKTEETPAVVKSIEVEFRGWEDLKPQTIIFLNKESKVDGSTYIDKPNTHVHEMRSSTQHWRYDLADGSKVDYEDCPRLGQTQWVEAKVINANIDTITIEFEAWTKYFAFGEEKNCVSQKQTVSRKSLYLAPHGTHTSTTTITSICSNVFNCPIILSGSSNRSIDSDDDAYDDAYDYHLDAVNLAVNSKRTSCHFYRVWLQMVERAHVQRSSKAFEPEDIYQCIANYDPSLGDGGQHDIMEALNTILDGVQDSLPPQLIFDTTKNIVHSDLIVRHHLKFGYDLVSLYFDGIQVREMTCLQCGFQQQMHSIFRELSLPVTTNYADVHVCVYSCTCDSTEYQVCSVRVPMDWTVKPLKFLVLNQINENLKPGRQCDADSHEIVAFAKDQINHMFADNSKNNGKFVRILQDSDKLIDAARCQKVVLFLVPVLNLSAHVHVSNQTKFLYMHLSDEETKFHLCVLSFPKPCFDYRWLKSQLKSSNDDFLQHAFGKPVDIALKNMISYFDGKIMFGDHEMFSIAKNGSDMIISTFDSGSDTIFDNVVDAKTSKSIKDCLQSFMVDHDEEDVKVSDVERVTTFFNETLKEVKNPIISENKKMIEKKLKDAVKLMWDTKKMDKFVIDLGKEKRLRKVQNCWNEYSAYHYNPRKDFELECKCADNHDAFDYIRSQTKILVGPKTLILTLNRGHGRSKYNHQIDFSDNLRLTVDNETRMEYNLFAVGNHWSSNVFSGHYTASVKKLNTKEWYHCDNTHITKMRYGTRSAVLMLYHLQ